MDDNPTSKKANAFLENNNQDFQFVLGKIKVLEKLNQKIAAYLEPNMRDYCQVANMTGSQLIILVANGSIATQLRFQTPDLLRKFKQDAELQKIKEIHCKVRPPQQKFRTQEVNPQAKKMALISAETAEMIRDIAESIDDPKLREVMERIAGHMGKK